MPEQMVCYSLAVCGDTPHIGQLLRSVASLRRHNASVPVWLFAYEDLPDRVATCLASHSVHVRRMGSYAGCLRKLSQHADALSTYPVLPKWLSLLELAQVEVSQLLCLDCDTFFFDDVAKLFQRYQHAEWYGREEPCSSLSPYFDPTYLDPAALAALVESHGLRAVPTLNTGVFLLNHGLHGEIAPLLGSMLDYLTRMLMWLSDYRNFPGALPFATPLPANGSLPMPFPSSNPWIADEVAFWLTLGQLPNVSAGVFAAQDFLQGGEFMENKREDTRAIACHYFSVNEDQFCNWLQVSEAGPICGRVR